MLDFPNIDTATEQAAPRAELAPVAKAAELAKVDLQDVALAHFGDWRGTVAEATQTLGALVLDLSTGARLAEAKALRQRIVNAPRTEARKVSGALKSRLTAVSRAVGRELELIEAAYEGVEKLISPQIETREAELAEERRLRDEKEAARVQGHKDRLATLAGYVEHARGLPACRIADGIEKVKAIEIDRDAWQEFADRAEQQKEVTLLRLEKMHSEAVAEEARAAEAARVAAANKAEAERLAKLAAELEQQQAELRAQQEAAAKAQREREETERAQAEAKAKKARDDSAFESWLSDTCPSGDVEAVQRQWEASAEYHELHGIEYRPVTEDTPEQASQQVLKATAPAPDATDRDAPASTSPSVGSMGAGQPADAGPLVGTAPAAEAPTLTLGQINERLHPVSITGDGVRTLGFTPVARKGSGVHFLASDLPLIARAIRRHLLPLALPEEKQAA